MRAFLERHRHLSLLVAMLLAQLFFLAYQIKGAKDVRLIRLWAVAVISPFEKAVDAVVDGLGSLVENYVALYGARQESQRLRAELDLARLRLQELEARAAEAEQLAALLELKHAYPRAPLRAAEVIGSSPAATTLTVLINRGSEEGLAPNMVVLTPDGVVGKVIAAFPGVSRVLLLSDPKSGVGALVADSRQLGVVKGTGGSLCRLEYIRNEEPVAVGAEVLTSGQDQVFPKGLPLGRVTAVRPGEFFQEIMVQPAARLTRLEHVLVLAGPPESLTATAQASDSSKQLAR
ncbi:MAG: rod shape-determining protein MreC [Acidobacteria bacterium]|nr:rod shape-determining protein MreC [Acidobacteriota bacterium]